MPVRKTYTKAEVASAIAMADHAYFGQMMRVRSDVTNAQFARNRSTGDGTHHYRGTGSDVGHTFRHVEGSAPGGKSTFRDADSLHRAVMALLNSDAGQQKLGALDAQSPDGDETVYQGRAVTTQTITGSVAGLNLYGRTQTGNAGKVKRVLCIVQKIGRSSIWVHTAYPTSFVAGT